MRHPVSLDAAVTLLRSQTVADVLVESKVDKVCTMKGCWLGLKTAHGEIHVTFKDESFFVPPTLMGKTVLVQGKLRKVVVTLEEAKHHAKEVGGDPAAVQEPAVRYELVASGLQVKTWP